MKKILTLIMTVAFCLTGAAKTADEVINELEKNAKAQVIRFNKELLAMQMGKTNNDSLEAILKCIDNGCVLIIEDAGKEKSEMFNNTTAELDTAYEPVVTAFDGDDRVKILGHAEGETIKEIAIVVDDGDDCVMVYLTGSIPKDKIGQLVNKNTINFN